MDEIDEREIIVEKIKLEHTKYITLFQSVMALSLGVFAVSLNPFNIMLFLMFIKRKNEPFKTLVGLFL